MALAPPKPKTLVLSDWPVYMWLVASVYMALALWSAVSLQKNPG